VSRPEPDGPWRLDREGDLPVSASAVPRLVPDGREDRAQS
jgi:hypothetical protein